MLRAEEIEAIDQSLLSNVSKGWRRWLWSWDAIAEPHRPGIPDEILARVRRVADLGALNHKGT